MNNKQLTAYGELIAVIESVSKIHPATIAKMLRNPHDQAFIYHFNEAIRGAAESSDDVTGCRLANLMASVGDIAIPTPVEQSTILVAYHHAKEVGCDMRKAFGEKIREKRHEKGLSLDDLASLTGLSAPHLSRIENGRYNVSLDTISKLSAALGEIIDLEN